MNVELGVGRNSVLHKAAIAVPSSLVALHISNWAHRRHKAQLFKAIVLDVLGTWRREARETTDTSMTKSRQTNIENRNHKVQPVALLIEFV